MVGTAAKDKSLRGDLGDESGAPKGVDIGGAECRDCSSGSGGGGDGGDHRTRGVREKIGEGDVYQDKEVDDKLGERGGPG